MARFLKTLIFFIVLFLLFDRLFYSFLWISPKLEVDKRLEEVITGKINKDLMVFGSSRGARNIIASQIEDSLSIEAYNLSYPGSDITFHEFMLRSVIKFNKKPKIVLLVIDNPDEFYPSSSIKFRLDRLYPLSKYDYINEELILKGEKSILSNFIVLERINKRNFDIRKKQFSALDTIFKCGSMPISFQDNRTSYQNDTILRKYETNKELKEKLAAFNSFQNLCTEHGIKMIVVFPPQLINIDNGLEERIRALTSTSATIYSYDKQNPVYQNKNYFYDIAHLKKNGAQVFTNEIINFLKVNFPAN